MSVYSLKTLLALIMVTAVALAAAYYTGTLQLTENKDNATVTEAVSTGRTRTPAAHPSLNGIMHDSLQPESASLAPAHPVSTSAPQALPPQRGRAHLYADVDPDAKFTHFRVGERNVKQIYADGDIIWVGTSGGVIRYDIKTDDYKLYDNRSGLLANGILHISKIDDQIIVGSYGGGMALLDESSKTWRIYNIPEGLGDAFVYDVLKADNGDIWIATWSGVNRIREGKLDERAYWDLFTVENTDGALPNDWVYALAMGKNGEVWMATEGGLARFKHGKWDNWNHAQGLGAEYERVKAQIQFTDDPARYSRHHTRQKSEMGLEKVNVAYNPNYIVTLLVDDEGSVWAGTWGGGLAHFNGTSWKNYTVSDGLPSNHVFSLHSDNEGRLLVGTSNGLAVREDDGGFRVFDTADGLYSNTVFSIATANDGSAWIGSYGGVARIAKLQ